MPKSSSMYNFICKRLHRLRSRNLNIIQIKPFSSSPKSTQIPPNQHSFAVNYLINSCGFSPERALSASRYVKFESPDKPDSVLAFFENQGFTQTQISSIIRKRPLILLSNPEKTLLPKLEFLKSKGVSSMDVAEIASSAPYFLQRNLEKIVIPSFDFFSGLLQSDARTLAVIKSCDWVLSLDLQMSLIHNVGILRETGVPDANIMYLLTDRPRVLAMSSDRLGEVVKEVEKIGFDPSRFGFVLGVLALSGMKKSTWEKKVEIYKKWGWTEDEILVTFVKYPRCMMASEEKIMRVMDFLVNEMGCESSYVARVPTVIGLSLEKRIIPRCALYQVLLSKGLIKTDNRSLMTLLLTPEKVFLNRFVNCQDEEAPELLKLYKEKLGLAG